MILRTIDTLDLNNKIVLLRVDLNVPRAHGKVTDATRITRIIPTIEYLQSRNAKIVILSHLGRPNGQFNRDLSLAPITNELAKHLQCPILFCSETTGNRPKQKIAKMAPKEILLLENLRFDGREELCDIEFANSLASLGDVFINDTFSCSHRNHASITALADIIPSSAGLLLQSEMEIIEAFLTTPPKPYTAIIGGAKISTKIDLLKQLTAKVDHLLLGGAMANSFLAAQNINVGRSLIEPALIETAKEILNLAKKNNCKILLPQDVVTAPSLSNDTSCSVVDINNIAQDQMVLDLGPQTTQLMQKIINESNTVIWNGPLGAFEQHPFDIASNVIARNIAYATQTRGLCSVAGGGDTLSVIKQSKLAQEFSYLSTGGGAFLEWLEGKTLPGIKALSK